MIKKIIQKLRRIEKTMNDKDGDEMNMKKIKDLMLQNKLRTQ